MFMIICIYRYARRKKKNKKLVNTEVSEFRQISDID